MLSVLRMRSVPSAESAWRETSLVMPLTTSPTNAEETLSAERSNELNASNSRRKHAQVDQLCGVRDVKLRVRHVRTTERHDTRSKTSSERREGRPNWQTKPPAEPMKRRSVKLKLMPMPLPRMVERSPMALPPPVENLRLLLLPSPFLLKPRN